MRQRTWFLLVVVAASSAAAVDVFIPKQPEVQQCAGAPARTIPPRGHVACTLNASQTIFLRSPR